MSYKNSVKEEIIGGWDRPENYPQVNLYRKRGWGKVFLIKKSKRQSHSCKL